MENNTNKEDFYIGWQDKAPGKFGRAARIFALLSLFLGAMTAAVLVINQKGFADSVFEFGETTQLEGFLTLDPVPMLRVSKEGRSEGMLLVGLGKFGSEATIDQILKKENIQLEQDASLKVTLKGTRIYHNGKSALELTDGLDSFVGAEGDQLKAEPAISSFGRKTLSGEILDPKCALGVMKPGYGKPHRSCAIRCISGGIPPIFRASFADGQVLHAILLGPKGEKINEEVLPFVADKVRICGELIMQDDWYVFKLEPESEIIRLSYYGAEGVSSTCGG
ncbi:MAG: hypothetical protein MRZ79_00930 [Bacteroidia bacterium]|nr:hypothetical protein [Bacteroidia bacterium]